MMWSLFWLFQNIVTMPKFLKFLGDFLIDNDSTKLYECKPITIDFSLVYKKES